MNTIKNTPAHCHGCSQFADCRQAQNMMADTPPEQGWVYEGDVYCAACSGANEPEYLVCYPQYEGESDSPTHCGGCGVPIIHELTAEGVEYVRKAIADDNGCCAEVWPTVWADYLA